MAVIAAALYTLSAPTTICSTSCPATSCIPHKHSSIQIEAMKYCNEMIL